MCVSVGHDCAARDCVKDGKASLSEIGLSRFSCDRVNHLFIASLPARPRGGASGVRGRHKGEGAHIAAPQGRGPIRGQRQESWRPYRDGTADNCHVARIVFAKPTRSSHVAIDRSTF